MPVNLNPLAGIQKMREERKEKQLRKSESMEKERALRKSSSMTKEKEELNQQLNTPSIIDSNEKNVPTEGRDRSSRRPYVSSNSDKNEVMDSIQMNNNDLNESQTQESILTSSNALVDDNDSIEAQLRDSKETKKKRFGFVPKPPSFPNALNPLKLVKKEKKEKEKAMGGKKKKKKTEVQEEGLPEFLKLSETFISPKIDSLFHIILGIVSCWIIGLLRLNFMWVFVMFYFVARLDTRRLHRTWKRLYNQYSQARIDAKRSKRSVDSSKEGAEWINSVVEKAWPNIGPFVFKTAQEQVKKIINEKLREKLPPQLEEIELVELDLGQSTPKISDMKTYPQISPDHYKLDLHLRYLGDISCMVVAKVKTKWVNLTIPIKLQNVYFESNVHIFLDLCNILPFVQTLNLSFSGIKLDFSLKPLQSIDLMDIPFVQPLLETAVREAMQSNPICVDLVAEQPDKDVEVFEEKTKKKGFLGVGFGGVMAIGKVLGVAKRRKSVVEKLYTSMLSVKLVECKGLIAADSNGKSDPYVILTLHDQTAKSIIIKKTLNPVWNTYFQFFVDDEEPKIITLEVFDYDQMNQDDFLGCTEVDFSDLKNDDDRRDHWASLVDRNGRPMRTGQIHVKLAYYVG